MVKIKFKKLIKLDVKAPNPVLNKCKIKSSVNSRKLYSVRNVFIWVEFVYLSCSEETYGKMPFVTIKFVQCVCTIQDKNPEFA